MVGFAPTLTTALFMLAAAGEMIDARPAWTENGLNPQPRNLRMEKVVVRSSATPPLPEGVKSDQRLLKRGLSALRGAAKQAAVKRSTKMKRSESGKKRSHDRHHHHHHHDHDHDYGHEHVHGHYHRRDHLPHDGRDHGHGHDHVHIHDHGHDHGHHHHHHHIDDALAHHSKHWAEHHGLIHKRGHDLLDVIIGGHDGHIKLGHGHGHIHGHIHGNGDLGDHSDHWYHHHGLDDVDDHGHGHDHVHIHEHIHSKKRHHDQIDGHEHGHEYGHEHEHKRSPAPAPAPHHNHHGWYDDDYYRHGHNRDHIHEHGHGHEHNHEYIHVHAHRRGEQTQAEPEARSFHQRKPSRKAHHRTKLAKSADHHIKGRGLLGTVKPLLAPLNAIPGFVTVSDLLFNDDSGLVKKVTSLVLHAQPGGGKTPSSSAPSTYSYSLMASNNEKTQVYLVPEAENANLDTSKSSDGQSFAATSNNGTAANAGTTTGPGDNVSPMVVKIVVPLVNETTGDPMTWCATFDMKPPSPLELQPCTNSTNGPEGVDNKSQRFAYNAKSGDLSPLYMKEVAGDLSKVAISQDPTAEAVVAPVMEPSASTHSPTSTAIASVETINPAVIPLSQMASPAVGSSTSNDSAAAPVDAGNYRIVASMKRDEPASSPTPSSSSATNPSSTPTPASASSSSGPSSASATPPPAATTPSSNATASDSSAGSKDTSVRLRFVPAGSEFATTDDVTDTSNVDDTISNATPEAATAEDPSTDDVTPAVEPLSSASKLDSPPPAVAAAASSI